MALIASSTIEKNSPDSTSYDYDAMAAFWTKVDDIVSGQSAVISRGKTYLPQFEDESDHQYQIRLSHASFTNIYRDIVENLAGKPFSEELTVADDTSDALKKIAEDIDGKGNNLHVFGSQVFFHGINSGIDWILVDYSKAPKGQLLTRSMEAQLGLRPYWVRVPARQMLMVITDRIGAKDEVVYARFIEHQKRRNGFGEELITRVREFERPLVELKDRFGVSTGTAYSPANFRVWEAKEELIGPTRTIGSSRKMSWNIVDQGPITIGVIPLVPFVTGRRKGNSWVLDAPLQDVADAQIEHYQQESNLKYAKVYSAFPILTGEGFAPTLDPVTRQPLPIQRSPNTILYAPAPSFEGITPKWSYLEISAQSLEFLRKEIERKEDQIRQLGRQPITSQIGNMTAATAGAQAQKGNTPVKDWALKLKDALEQCFVLTAMWLKSQDEAEVKIYTDFDILDDDADSLNTLATMRKNKDLSRRTLWSEAKRRGTLSPEFDADAEEDALDEEEPTPADINEQRAAMGLPPLPDPNNPEPPDDPEARPTQPPAPGNRPPAPQRVPA